MTQITILKGLLLGTRWCNPGDVLRVPDECPKDRAETLVKRGHASTGGMPPKPKAKPSREATIDQPAGQELTQVSPPVRPTNGSSLSDIGVGGRVIEYLNTAGLYTVEDVRAYLDAGKKLEDLKGIGDATAASLKAQLADA